MTPLILGGFAVKHTNGRLYGPFSTASDAMEWINAVGHYLAKANSMTIIGMIEPTSMRERLGVKERELP